MADIFSHQKRSEVMSKVRASNTKPERIVRKALHALGYRFRINRKDLAGKPDIFLPKHDAIIFVHGCFWHQHQGCTKSKLPSTNIDFWETKLLGNVQRDKSTVRKLKKEGRRVLVLWECNIKSGLFIKQLMGFLPDRQKTDYLSHSGGSDSPRRLCK